MRKNRFIAIIVVTILFLNILSINVFSMNLPENSTIQNYISDLKEIENDYYIAGKAVLQDKCANKNKEKLKKDINFYMEKISELKNNMSDYLSTLKNDQVQSRNILALIFVTEYFEIGLKELLIILDSESDTIDYNSLESYFYSKVLAKQTISFIESQLNTN